MVADPRGSCALGPITVTLALPGYMRHLNYHHTLGELDYRVPIEEAEQMYVVLKKQRVPAKFVRYPESYHGGWSPWRQVHVYYSELKWCERYLR